MPSTSYAVSRMLFAAKLAAVVSVLSLLSLQVTPAQAQADAADTIVVALMPGTSPSTVAAELNTTVIDVADGGTICTLAVPSDTTAAAFTTTAGTSPGVLSAEADAVIGTKTTYSAQIHVAFDAGGQPGAYVDPSVTSQVDGYPTENSGVGMGTVVAVIDTGVDLEHPALQGHLIQGANMISSSAAAEDLPDGLLNDGVGHGTMVAGIIAEYAPGAQIMPIRVLNGDGMGTIMTVVKGIEYAIHHGANVINLSLGTNTYSDALEDAIEDAYKAGVIVVAAAGNNGSQVAHYPAALPNVISVAAVDQYNVKPAWSNYGPSVCVCAPGVGIRSTYWNGGYANWSGTSFSAPFVSAEAADVLSSSSEMSVDDVTHRICDTANGIGDQNPLFEGLLGEGIIDIQNASGGDN